MKAIGWMLIALFSFAHSVLAQVDQIGDFRRRAEAGDLVAMRSLANAYFSGIGVTKDYAEAARLFRKAGEGGDAPSLTRLGDLYASGMGVVRDTGRAVLLYRQAAELGDPGAMFALGVVYRDGQGVPQDYAESARHFEAALRTYQTREGGSLGEANAHQAVALARGKLGARDEALHHFDAALTIYERLGIDVRSGQVLADMAQILLAQGQLAEAEVALQSALAIKERGGADGVDVAEVLRSLGFLYQRVAQWEQSELVFLRALRINEKVLGPEHPQVAVSLNDLAKTYNEQGRFTEAEPLFKRASAITSRSLGVDSQAAAEVRKAANACSGKDICTPVRVFFGTDREPMQGPNAQRFSPSRADKLTLGAAVVTVPKKAARRVGEINRPRWWERVFLFVSEEGDPARHFTLPKDGLTVYGNEEDFLSAVRLHRAEGGEFKDHAFIFIHGYWVPYDAALYRTAQIAHDLGSDGEAFGTAFLYSWPSAGDLKGYIYDLESAAGASSFLANFIDIVVRKSGVTNIHLVAHSMGNVALLAALQKLPPPPPGVRVFNQIVLAAPDVDAAEFRKIASSISGIAKGITLYASANDVALKAAKDARRGLPRAGDVPQDGPVIVAGIDSIDVSALSTELFSVRHALYSDRRELG